MRLLRAAIRSGAFWKLGSDLLGRLLQYALLWVAARTLSGAEEFGRYTFALSIGLMLAQVADFGLQLFVQRELARLAIPGASARPYFTDEGAAARLIGGGLVIKAALSLVALGIMVAVALAWPVASKGAVILVGLAAVLSTTLDYLSYCFRALGKLRYEALAALLGRSAHLGLGVGLLLLGAGIWGLAIAGNLAMLLGIGFIYLRLRRYVRPTWRPDWGYWRGMLGQPTAIGIGVIFSIISFRLDNLLILPISGEGELGIYNAAYKLFEPSQIVPGVLLAATFPMIAQSVQGASRREAQGAGKLRSLLAQNLLLLLLLALGVALAMLILAAPLVRLLYGGRYSLSAPVLQILAAACVPMYLNYALTHTLIALDRPRLFASFTLAALVVNLASNLALIPLLGIAGAALATVITEVALLLLCSVAVIRLVRGPLSSLPEAVSEPRAEAPV